MEYGNIGYRRKITAVVDRLHGETDGEYHARLDALLSNLEGLSSRHVTWYTHRNDGTASCWICEVLLIARAILGFLGETVTSEHPDGGAGLEQSHVDEVVEDTDISKSAV